MTPTETTCPACGATDPQHQTAPEEQDPIHWTCDHCGASWVQPPAWLSRLIGEPDYDDDEPDHQEDP